MYLDGTMLYNVIPGVIPLREMASVSKETNSNPVLDFSKFAKAS